MLSNLMTVTHDFPSSSRYKQHRCKHKPSPPCCCSLVSWPLDTCFLDGFSRFYIMLIALDCCGLLQILHFFIILVVSWYCNNLRLHISLEFDTCWWWYKCTQTGYQWLLYRQCDDAATTGITIDPFWYLTNVELLALPSRSNMSNSPFRQCWFGPRLMALTLFPLFGINPSQSWVTFMNSSQS